LHGIGVCAATAPRHFALDPSGRSQPRAKLVEPDPMILDVALSCPAEAIRIRAEAPAQVPPG
jgi:ferredoxin